MALLGHRNTATTKKLDFKNSNLTSVEAKFIEVNSKCLWWEKYGFIWGIRIQGAVALTSGIYPYL
jgi:hypothetical protein